MAILLIFYKIFNFFLFAESSVLINQELTELMEQLEFAISSGEHKRAALLARELALRKVACTLQRSTQANSMSAQSIV